MAPTCKRASICSTWLASSKATLASRADAAACKQELAHQQDFNLYKIPFTVFFIHFSQFLVDKFGLWSLVLLGTVTGFVTQSCPMKRKYMSNSISSELYVYKNISFRGLFKFQDLMESDLIFHGMKSNLKAFLIQQGTNFQPHLLNRMHVNDKFLALFNIHSKQFHSNL